MTPSDADTPLTAEDPQCGYECPYPLSAHRAMDHEFVEVWSHAATLDDLCPFCGRPETGVHGDHRVRHPAITVERAVVECDQDCGAFEEPESPKEVWDAYEHWHLHGYLHGCSHGS